MTMDSVPLLPGANLLGHGHRFRDERLSFLREAALRGDVTRMRFLHRQVLIVSSPEAAHEVLVEQARKFEKSPAIRLGLHDLAGQGLFTSEGELWQRQRRLMSPLFRAGPVAAYAKTMNDVTRHALEHLHDGDRVDVAHEMTRITMGIVAATLFGAEKFDRIDEMGEALTTVLQWLDHAMNSPHVAVQVQLMETFEAIGPHLPSRLDVLRQKVDELLSAPHMLPGRTEPAMVAAVKVLDDVMHGMISERRANPKARVDLLTKLLLARDTEGGLVEGMSDEQVRDEANTLFVAGHETTANALAWCFYLLARNPEAKARVQAEADAFGSEGPATWTPDRLTYTSRVFKEALRLYPPLLVLARRSLEPFELAGETWPRHTVVLVNPYGIQMNPRVWKDPDHFDPDRFTPEEEGKRHKAAWIPFGLGPRVCIGNHFALMEGPIVLSTLMRNLRFEIDASRTAEAETFATLRPKGGVPAIVRRQ